MPYVVVPGLPTMKVEIERLQQGFKSKTLKKDEMRLAKKLFKAIAHLSRDPFYPSLESHEIEPLTKRFSTPPKADKVYESYLENNTPAAGRLFWVYGPRNGMITLVGLEPHPEDKKNSGYARVQLSRMPTMKELEDEAAAQKQELHAEEMRQAAALKKQEETRQAMQKAKEAKRRGRRE